jgi:ubiquitin carboxyl-terminal hydrolase L3
MSTLLHTLGLSPTLSFHDVYSISDPDLLSFVPRPAHALLLVFPVSQTYETFRHQEDASKPDYAASGKDEEVLWYKQTIGNACGLIGLLHAVSNGKAREFVTPGSELEGFIQAATPLAPGERARLIEESEVLERAHAEAARGGDTVAPAVGEDVDLHYVCFVESKGSLWEMDGRRKGPIKRGELGEGEDVLSEKALELGVKAFLKREEEKGGGDLRFSLITLAESLD